MLNLNQYPYYDDHDSSKNYHKILFHPAKPVQARELTQVQSIIQEQIKRHGDHVFKNGTVVIPGHVFYDDQVHYLKLVKSTGSVLTDDYIDSLIGKEIVGGTSLVKAHVSYAVKSEGNNLPVLYIKYLTSNGVDTKIRLGETIVCPDLVDLTLSVDESASYTGTASICSIAEGVYYVNGYFVGVAPQTIVTGAYSKASSFTAGLEYKEEFITEKEDDSLYDNAAGFSNYGAPGAHRLKVTLQLASKEYDYTVADAAELKFINLLKVKNGEIQYLNNDTKYAEIEKWVARRMYDESGDFVVAPFKFTAKEKRSNTRGEWVTGMPVLQGDLVTNGSLYFIALNDGYTGATAPVHELGIESDGSIFWSNVRAKDYSALQNSGTTIVSSTDIKQHRDEESCFMVTASAGKAYIKGFEVTKQASTNIIIPKARSIKFVDNSQVFAPAGQYVRCNKILGLPVITNEMIKVDLKNIANVKIGEAWVRSVEVETLDPVAANVEAKVFLVATTIYPAYSASKHLFKIVDPTSTFSAQIIPVMYKVPGSVSCAGTTTITGSGTNFNFDVEVGDLIYANGVWGSVANIVGPNEITSSASHTSTTTNVALYIGRADLVNLGSYLYPVVASDSLMQSVRDNLGNIDTEYTITKSFTFTTTGTSHALNLSGDEYFSSIIGNLIAINSGALNTREIIPTATYTISNSGQTMTIGGLANTTAYIAYLLVRRVKTAAKEKIKILSSKSIILNNAGIYDTSMVLISNAATYKSLTIPLTEADCIRLVKVTESGSPTDKVNYVSSGEADITNLFTQFDSGQRDTHYDIGTIQTSSSRSRPIKVTFEYFQHSDGDYFSADSYSNIPKKLIRPYLTKSGLSLNLINCLDFRSRISDAGTEFKNSSGGQVSEPIVSGGAINLSYSYYVPAICSIYLHSDGTLDTLADPTSVKLVDLELVAYTNYPEKVIFIDRQPKNYRKADVGKLDERLNNVEYYVALGELERATAKTSIKDEFGLEQTKAGFFVDSFGDIESVSKENSTCTFITHENALTVEMVPTTIGVLEKNATPAARSAGNYAIKGHMITLAYSEVEGISQPLANKEEEIQPFVATNFDGTLILQSAIDNTVEQNQKTTTSSSYRQEQVTNFTWSSSVSDSTGRSY